MMADLCEGILSAFADAQQLWYTAVQASVFEFGGAYTVYTPPAPRTPEERERTRADQRRRYATDQDYREAHRTQAREYYQDHEEYRRRSIALSKERRRQRLEADPEYRAKLRARHQAWLEKHPERVEEYARRAVAKRLAARAAKGTAP